MLGLARPFSCSRASVYPTLQSRSRIGRANACRHAQRCTAQPQQQQQQQQPAQTVLGPSAPKGLNNTHYLHLDAHCKVQEAAHSQPAKRKPTKLYDLQCRASRRLLQLLAALGSGQLLGETTPEQNPVSEGDFSDEEQLGLSDAATDGAAEGPAAAAAAAAGAFPSVNQEEVTRKLDSLLEEVMEQCLPNGKKYKPDPFQVNCIMAVLADRGELGLCLPDVADLLPHDTPGSRCWFEKEFAQQARQVFLTDESFHRKLKPAGVSYDHVDLLKSFCDVLVAADGSILTLIKCSRRTGPKARRDLAELASSNKLGFFRSGGKWSFTRCNLQETIVARIVAKLRTDEDLLRKVRDSAEQADKDGDAQALKCTLMAILHHLMSIDAFIGGKRSKEQLTAAYLGIDHEMTVAGLSYGKDTAVNIQASFNTDPETVNTSLFDQIQQLLHQRYIVIKLPEDLPEDIRGQQLLVEVPITFMLDQPALIGFLGLGQEGYSCQGKLFNPFSPEDRNEHRELFLWFDIDTGKAWCEPEKAWVCLSPQEACGDCSNCKVAAVISSSPNAFGLEGAQLVVQHKEETLQTLHLRSGDRVTVLREMNGIPENFGNETPLVQLRSTWQTPYQQALRDRLRTTPNHPLAQALQDGCRLMAISRTPALGHKGGPDMAYPNAAIRSPNLLTMMQVAFMHMAKNVTWRYFMQLWLELLTLDQRENLQSDPASDMGVAAADLDEDGFLAVIGGDAMEAYLANKERAKKFVTGTIKAGNPMLVNTRGTEDFDKLKGNKDFKPLHKLLLHRHFILDALADMPERRAEWELAGQTLESFIDIVWIRGYSSDDDRWEGTMLAREFVWRFSKLAPPERFANYIHLMQQWPLLQPDPRKAGVLDGSVRHVSPKLPILKRPDVKQVSDEHGEAMHRRVLAQKHNQGGGKAHASAGTRERPNAAVTRDLLGIMHKCGGLPSLGVIEFLDLKTHNPPACPDHDNLHACHECQHGVMHSQSPCLTPSSINISPSGSLLTGSIFTLTAISDAANVLGGTLTVVSTPPGITCQPSNLAGNSLQTTCTVAQAAAPGQYALQVTWVTAPQPELYSSTVGTAVQVIQCTYGECCNTNSKTFQPSSYVCRKSGNPCRLNTYCTGKTADCPSVVTLPDGESCPWKPRGRGCANAQQQQQASSGNVISSSNANLLASAAPQYTDKWPACTRLGICLQGVCALKMRHPDCCVVPCGYPQGDAEQHAHPSNGTAASAGTVKDTQAVSTAGSGYWRRTGLYCWTWNGILL